MARKCARTFSIVVEKGKKSILDVGHLLPVGIARSVLLQDISVLVVEQGGSSNHWAIWAWSIVFGGRQSTPLNDRMSATATPHALVHLLDGKHAWAVISRGCTHLGSRRRRTTSSRTSTGQRKVFTEHGKVNAVAVLQSLDS